jgi:hypothetical protein
MNTYVPGDDLYAAYQTFTVSEWKKLEKNGAIFLPAAGSRYPADFYGTEINTSSFQEVGQYWTSTKYFVPGYDNWESGESYSLHFYSGELYTRGHYNVYGFSVRLAKDI